MRGIDTNILVRFLTCDDPDQADRAAEILTRECSMEFPGFLSSVVLAELVWTLERVYKYPREDVSNALHALLNARELRFEYPDETRYAARLYAAGSGDFADVLIGAIALRLGCSDTVTFDRKAARLDTFTPA